MKAFKCPTCGCSRLEEAMTGVTVTSEILDINLIQDDDVDEEDPGYVEIDYGTELIQGGEVSHYQCMKCGWALPCNSREELHTFLSKPKKETT